MMRKTLYRKSSCDAHILVALRRALRVASELGRAGSQDESILRKKLTAGHHVVRDGTCRGVDGLSSRWCRGRDREGSPRTARNDGRKIKRATTLDMPLARG